MKTILVIGGFARSGKTSSLSLLRDEFNIPIVSTSMLLDEFILKLEQVYGVPIPLEVEERRRHKIAAAEEILVPIYGRESFARAAAKRIFELPHEVISLETIGGEEWKLLQLAIQDAADQRRVECRFVLFNVRRSSELPGVDIRVLLEGAHTIQNEGSLGDLCDEWEAELRRLF